jgi:hypothetical protein
MIFIIKHKSYLDPSIILSILNVAIDQIQIGICTKKENDPKVKERLLPATNY